MGYWSELGGLILTPGSLLGPESGFPGFSPGFLRDALFQGDKSGLIWPFLVLQYISWGCPCHP